MERARFAAAVFRMVHLITILSRLERLAADGWSTRVISLR